MALYRTVDVMMWTTDAWYGDLGPLEKLLFLYLFTNHRVTPCGAYEIRLRDIAFETGIPEADVEAMLPRLAPKVRWWPALRCVAVQRFYARQKANSNPENFRRAALAALAKFPAEVRAWLGDAYPELAAADIIPSPGQDQAIPIPSGVPAEPIPIPSPSHGEPMPMPLARESATATATATGAAASGDAPARDDAPYEQPAPLPGPGSPGWPLVNAMLTALEDGGRMAEGWAPSPRWRKTQTEIGAELVRDGRTEADVGGVTRWLLSDPHWGAKDIDMRIVREKIDNWLREGRPATARKPARPTERRDDTIKPNQPIDHGEFAGAVRRVRASVSGRSVAPEPAGARAGLPG